MNASPRLRILLVILALAAGLVYFSPPPHPGSAARVVEANASRRVTEEPVSTPERTHRSDAQASPTLLALRDRGEQGTPSERAFTPRDWTPPPPPPPPPAPALPPPPPQAPPLPFTVIGKQLESGQWTVFLSNQDRTYTIQAGMVIESTYRVEHIAPPTLTLIYLPLNQSQTLAIGPAE